MIIKSLIIKRYKFVIFSDFPLNTAKLLTYVLLPTKELRIFPTKQRDTLAFLGVDHSVLF